MCFYCWICSPRNPSDPEDGYYSMTICCFSKNILPSIIWLFSIRFIFDLIFTIIFAIFEIPLFIILTLIVGIGLILAILGFKLKLIWIYYCFGFLTIILLILDLGSLSYIIYAISEGNGWLYNYAHKHISSKSDESLFTISDRKYTATDIILIIFAIFLLFSFLHDLTNLLMINRSIQFLKRFPTNLNKNKNQRISNQMDSVGRRNGFNGQQSNGERYAKRPSNLSIPSIVAPHIEATPRLSYIEISHEPITPRVTTIPYNQAPHHQVHEEQQQYQQPKHQVHEQEQHQYQHLQHQQSQERPNALINGGYSFIETIPSRRTISNAAAATSTPGYEVPNYSTEYSTLERSKFEVEEEDNRIQEQDLRSPFANPKKDSKNEKSQPLQPNEVPPIPPKSVTLSSRSQNSESSSFIYENVVISNLEQNHIPSSPFISIAVNPLNLQRTKNMDSLQESDGSSDSSFNEHPSTWDRRDNGGFVERENQVNEGQTRYSNYNVPHGQVLTANLQSSSRTGVTNTRVISESQRYQDQTRYSNINPQLSQEQVHESVNQQSSTTWTSQVNVISVTHESHQNGEKNNQGQIIYSNIPPELPRPRQILPNSESSNDDVVEQVNPNEIEEDKNDDTISFTSNDSNDVVSFWSHHPSTRRRRASKDLLNERGFLSDSSAEEERIPKILPAATKKAQPLKSFGLTQILQLEKREVPATIDSDTVINAENVNEQEETGKMRSDSLIFALESIKVMEEEEKTENQNIKTEATTERYSNKMEHVVEYGINETVTHSRYANTVTNNDRYEITVADTPSTSETMLKRESMFFQPNEIPKPETYETPPTHLKRNFESKSEIKMTPETPIIPSTSNFFDAWGKATDKNSDEPKTTVPLKLKLPKIGESFDGQNFVEVEKSESETDSTMTFSPSSDEEDSESDFEARFEKLKHKLQIHLPQILNNDKQNVAEEGEANISSSNDTVANVEPISSSNHEEKKPPPFKFKRLPLIGSAPESSPSTAGEIFSTPPTTPINQNSSTNLPQQLPPLPRSLPPSTVSHFN